MSTLLNLPNLTVILFDLDETLMPEECAIHDSFLATGQWLAKSHDVDPNLFADSARSAARDVWARSTLADAGRAIGMSSSEALWCPLDDTSPAFASIGPGIAGFRARVWTQVLESLGIGVTDGLAHGLDARFRKERATRHEAYPETKRVLNQLRRRYKLGLVTNGTPGVQRFKADRAGLTPFFDTVVVSGDVGSRKPDAKVFLSALERLGAEPSEAIMIGDRPGTDIEGASRLGMRAILVARGRHSAEPGPPPDLKVEDLRQVPELAGLLTAQAG